MSKSIVFLADGMADEPLEELGGRTPLEAVETPFMDSIAEKGASGTFLTLPEGFPTSSDVANMSVLGYDLAKCYSGRGPLEAASMGIELGRNDIAFRCNLVEVSNGILQDYSADHIGIERSSKLMRDLQKEFGSDKVSFHAGVSYRNLIVLHGKEFSEKVMFHKPDSSQGEKLSDLVLTPGDSSKESSHTVEFLNILIEKTSDLLAGHMLNENIVHPANMIWPWSPGRKPDLQPFSEKYPGVKGAVISAVDVIFGLAICSKMDIIRIPGATGFIDTNYKGKAEAAVKALEDHDFVYLHVEAIDECSHMGDLKLKMKAIKDFDSKIVGPVMDALKGEEVTFAVLPDHPVPVKLRKHTRTPVPFAVCGKHVRPDSLKLYSETLAPRGGLGHLKGDGLMKLVLNIK
ncbi:MAG TPA: cofactor-independent phosphoglycerate mutase [Lentisphaeria bacterium]|nr:MAG: cofactor-independent phosphoglycerate mutase [Lentisphaerae bacterium GWF2_49_21]HBC87898.1 cofactor-independent phosphoglycerate mutase [Lentisphaeria bacterium]